MKPVAPVTSARTHRRLPASGRPTLERSRPASATAVATSESCGTRAGAPSPCASAPSSTIATGSIHGCRWSAARAGSRSTGPAVLVDDRSCRPGPTRVWLGLSETVPAKLPSAAESPPATHRLGLAVQARRHPVVHLVSARGHRGHGPAQRLLGVRLEGPAGPRVHVRGRAPRRVAVARLGEAADLRRKPVHRESRAASGPARSAASARRSKPFTLTAQVGHGLAGRRCAL